MNKLIASQIEFTFVDNSAVADCESNLTNSIQGAVNAENKRQKEENDRIKPKF
jgi:hypothetical protein